MKKHLVIIILLIGLSTALFAGGIVQNTNQSAEFISMMNRNASTDADAVYFNPAAVTSLTDGWHLYVSNQTIWQERTVTTDWEKFNVNTYEGTTFAPVFPNLYIIKKAGNFAFSFGFAPVGGGGSAEFDKGLPSFEENVATYVGLQGVLGYSLASSFTGSSVYLGGQIAAAYKIHDMVSVSLGIRGISASNAYEGYLKDVTLILADTSVNPLPDIEVDVTQTGTTFTPIIGVNITPIENLNIGFRYEFMSALEIENETAKDGTKGILSDEGMFPDGAISNADIPALIGVGIQYKASPSLKIQASYDYYVYTSDIDWDWDDPDTPAKVEVATDYVDDGYEYGVGIEYKLNEKLWLNTGVLTATSGAKDKYQSDLSYSLNSNTIGVGGKYCLNPNMNVVFGMSNTFYETGQNEYDFDYQKWLFDKTTLDIAIGFNYKF